ncbi:hypothetical protein ACHWQZ_G009037 [Mnemiopsis leidyi]
MCCEDMIGTILKILLGNKSKGNQPADSTMTTIENKSYKSTDLSNATLRHRHCPHHTGDPATLQGDLSGSLDSLPITEASSSFQRTSSWEFSEEEEPDQEVFVLKRHIRD